MDVFRGVLFAVRLAQLAALAQEKELEFHHILRDYQMDRRYPHFACLRKGKDRFAYNLMTGEYKDYRITAFDYHYQIEKPRHRSKRSSQPGLRVDLGNGARISLGDPEAEVQEYEFSGVILRTGLPLQSLSIRPFNPLMRGVTDFLGTSGVQFELNEFNNQFYVDASDPGWAFDILPQATLEFLLQSPRYTLEMNSGLVLAYRDSLFTPEEFFPALDLISGILERLPTYLLKELKERQPWKS